MSHRITRRLLLAGTATAVASPAAADWPSGPIRVVVPFAPGGQTDGTARFVAGPMAQILGKPVVVENRPGASGTIGAGEVARAAPDGHTLLVDAAGHASNFALYPRLPFDYARDFAPVTQLAISPQILAVHPSLPVASLAELVALAKRRPGELSYGSPGNGSAGHLAAAYLAHLAGIRAVQVAYRGGGPAIQDLLPVTCPSPSAPSRPRSRSSRRASCGRWPFPACGASGPCPTCRPSRSSATRTST